MGTSLPGAGAGPRGALGPLGESAVEGEAAEAGKVRKEASMELGEAHPRLGTGRRESVTEELISAELRQTSRPGRNGPGRAQKHSCRGFQDRPDPEE